jgi:hypothetical protein
MSIPTNPNSNSFNTPVTDTGKENTTSRSRSKRVRSDSKSGSPITSIKEGNLHKMMAKTGEQIEERKWVKGKALNAKLIPPDHEAPTPPLKTAKKVQEATSRPVTPPRKETDQPITRTRRIENRPPSFELGKAQKEARKALIETSSEMNNAKESMELARDKLSEEIKKLIKNRAFQPQTTLTYAKNTYSTEIKKIEQRLTEIEHNPNKSKMKSELRHLEKQKKDLESSIPTLLKEFEDKEKSYSAKATAYGNALKAFEKTTNRNLST